MSSERKRELARKLLDARGEWLAESRRGIIEKMTANNPERMNKIRATVFERLRNLQIDLHAEFFSEEQLIAELDFYESDIGKSIVKNRILMNEELKRRGPVTFADLDAELKSELKGGAGHIEAHLKKWPPSDDR